ncbi:MAG: DUF4920 domain-containing protein [Ignavibacteria bacterium]
MFKKLLLAAFLSVGIFCIQNIASSQDDPATNDSKESKTEDIKKADTDATEEKSDQPEGIKMEDGILYGKNYEEGMEVVEFTDLMSNPSEYKDKTVLVKGNISEVCQKAGCWLVLSDGSNSSRVTTLHNFFVPKDATGSQVIVLGKFIEAELTEDQAKHYNEESNNPKADEDIKGTVKVFEIEADGVKILNTSDKN